jgi:hypothetical protein
MLRREEVKVELKKDEDRGKSFGEKLSSLREKITGRLLDRAEGLQKRLLSLFDAKRSLLEGPCSKGELLAEAKAALRQYQQQFGLERLLGENLKKSMLNGGAYPLRPDHLKAMIFPDNDFSKIIYALIDEALLEKVVASIPDMGTLSAAERARELKKLDDQILQLEKEIGEGD